MPSKKYLCEYVERYLDKELQISKNMTRSGFKSYVLTLNMLLRYASNKMRIPSDKIRAAELNYKIIYDFMTETSDQKSWKPATWNARLAGIKSFVRFLSLEDIWFLETYNRVKLIQSQKVDRKDPFYLNNQTVTKAIESYEPEKWTQFRDYTIVQFMMATGLRVAEVCNLKVKDILWLSKRKIHIRFKGKGRKQRVLPIIDNALIKNLSQLLEFPDVNSKYVFPGVSGSKMSTSNLRKRVDRFFSPQGLKKKVTPHVLRRSAAMNWLSKEMDIFHVSAMLGHEHLSTTEHYLRSNLEDKEAELKRIGMNDNEFKPFKPKKGQDEFLDRLMKRIQKGNKL